jgi:calreticulin
VSNNKKDSGEAGTWDLSAGTYFADEEKERGLHTSEDARFYSISTAFDEFSNEGKPLVVQFSVKHDQKIDCGGGYIKLMPAGLDQSEFNGDSVYNIMFGPDICGYSTKRVHFILNKNGENHLINQDIPCETDEFTHVYTMLLKPDNTWSVYIDGEEKASGNVEDSWDILPPKEINDPEESKPADWVDEKMIDDPEDVKPEGWDDIPAEIEDEEAEKPEDWDDELDGDWEAPKVPNPDYKGPWAAKKIPNPAYKGEWEHPQIPNPAYKPDPSLYSFDSHKYLGIEIWQVKAGSIFSNFLVSDNIEEALAAQAPITAQRAHEESLKAEADEEAAKKAAEEAAENEEEEDEEEGEDREEL